MKFDWTQFYFIMLVFLVLIVSYIWVLPALINLDENFLD